MRYTKKCFFAGLLSCSMLLNALPLNILADEIRATTDCVLRVNFDDNVSDQSGRGNDGEIIGTPEFVQGKKGKALHIVNDNGSTSATAKQYVDFGKSSDLMFKDRDFSISYWYKSDNGVSAGGALLSNKNFNSGGNVGWTIGDFNTGLRVNFTAQGGSRKDVYNFAPIDGVWHHVAINFDRMGSITTYLDGKVAGATDIASEAGKSIDVANFVVGADGFFKNGLNDAYIDELSVYTSLRTVEEIQQEVEDVDKEDADEVLYLDFDEQNAKDASGHGNDALATGVTYAKGAKGYSAHIVNPTGNTSEAATSFIKLADTPDMALGTDDFTITYWYKSGVGTENGGALISNKDYNRGANDGFAIGSFTKNVRVNLAFDNTRKDIYFGVVDDKWHHGAVTFQRDGNMIAYSDGVKKGESDISAFKDKSMDVEKLYIGADGKGNNSLLDSYVDEVRIFKSVKTADEIHAIYSEITPDTDPEPDNEELLYASFDGNAKDQSGKANDGTMIGDPSFVDGVKGDAIHIINKNGSTSATADQYVNFGNKVKFGTNDYSLSFWYSSDNGVSSGGALISNKDYNSGSNPGFTIGNFDTGLRYNFVAQGGARKDVYNFAPIDGDWHHVVINVDRKGKIQTYLDGKIANSTDISSESGKSVDAGSFVVGADGYFKNALNDAFVDELHVYKGLLAEDDITAQYQPAYLGYQIHLHERFLNEASKNSYYEPAKLAELKVSIDAAKAALEAKDYHQMSYLIEDMDAKMAAVKADGDQVVDGQMLYTDFNNEDANDVSGRGNHGVMNGSPSFDKGVSGKAIHIQNSNGSTTQTAKQYVNFGQGEDLKFGTRDFAIGFWYKTVNGGGNEAAIISNKDWSSGSNPGLTIANFKDSVRVNYTAAGSSRDDIYGLSVNDDKWHYIAINFDRDKSMSAYIDGSLAKDSDISDTFGKDIDVMDFVLGADGMKTQGLDDAYLDELRVFNRLMSTADMDNFYVPYRLEMKLSDMEAIITKAKNEGYDADKITAFEAVIEDVKELMLDATVGEKKALIKKLTFGYDVFLDTQKPLMSFEVLSDVHVEGTDDTNSSNANMIDALQDIAMLDPDSSAIMFPGDITDGGAEAQYKGFYNILKKYNSTESIVALGNHDVRWLCSGDDRNEASPTVPTCKVGTSPFAERYLSYNKPYMGEQTKPDQLYFDRWIDGYHFITLNTEKDLKDNAYLSPEQLSWLEETLAENADPKKPIFIQVHQTLKGTADYEAGDSVGEQDAALKEVLSKFPQSVLFTGHVHNGSDIAGVHAGTWGHQVDVPSFRYQSYGDSRAQIGYQINVFADYVEVKFRDFKNDEWLTEFSTTFAVDDKLPDDAANDIPTKDVSVSAGSTHAGEPASHTLDDDSTTIWHSEWSGVKLEDNYLLIDLGGAKAISGFRYLPRQDSANGRILDYEIYTRNGTSDTFQKVANGTFKNDKAWKFIGFEAHKATEVKLVIVSAVNSTNNERIGSAAEIRVVASNTADFTALNAEIANAKKLAEMTYLYTAASIEAYKKEIAKAIEISGTAYLLQNEVDAAYTALVNAKSLLKKQEDTTLMKSILKSAIDKAIAAEASTEFKTLAPSVKALIIATRNAAELVYNDANATNAQCLEAWMNVADALHFLDFQANKATLLSLITVCNDINTDEYDIGVEAFIAALDNAKTVYANAHALQKSINAAQTRLEDARNGLAKNPTNVNKSVLEYTISTMEGKVGNGDKYKQDASWTAYRKALIDAKAVMANAEATQAEVDTSLYALTSAYENIRLLPSEEQLAELNGFIAVVNGLNRNNYSAAQWKVIDETAVKAQAMINDFDETKFPMLQREMADALGVINEVTTPKSENQGMNGSPDSANPNTGDRTNVTGIFFALFLSGCGIFMIKKKRNRNTQA